MKTALQQLEEQHKELSDRMAELVEKHKQQGEKIAAMKNPCPVRMYGAECTFMDDDSIDCGDGCPYVY